MPLPRSALLTLWLNAVLDGRVGPDDFAAAVRDQDPQHLVLDWPESSGPLQLEQLPAQVRRIDGVRAALALPVPGDPLGLAGPADFNAAAVELGEAVVLVGPRPLGLLPGLDARTVIWETRAAQAPVEPDPYEASRQLRQVLLHATAELVRLDVASWQPEIPDLLLNLEHRPALPLPAQTPPRAVEALERADLCLEIVDLARAEDGGAVTSFEIAARSRCLDDLDVAARRAVVAFCSASLIAP
ncbi:MAG: hypothetical protein NTV23_06440 [Propionibacteriales bacterium]|nr:hypothetical protein [Propionibacteriales bacterium]